MHELSVTESILSIALKHAEKANAKKVTDIHIIIGDLSSIIGDSVSFYWDIITKDTLCANSKLHFNRTPAIIQCLDCENQYNIDRELEPCSQCKSRNIKVISGEEFRLDSIEIEK